MRKIISKGTLFKVPSGTITLPNKINSYKPFRIKYFHALPLAANQHPGILKDICIMKSFPKLMNLFLSMKTIYRRLELNGELRGHWAAKCPIIMENKSKYRVKNIIIGDNNIRSLKPLRKGNFPKLVMLVVGRNCLSDVKNIE